MADAAKSQINNENKIFMIEGMDFVGNDLGEAVCDSLE